jgi:hypothetical protein
MPNHGVVFCFLIYLCAALVDHSNSQFEILIALLRRCLALRLFYPFGCFSQPLIDEFVRGGCHHYHENSQKFKGSMSVRLKCGSPYRDRTYELLALYTQVLDALRARGTYSASSASATRSDKCAPAAPASISRFSFKSPTTRASWCTVIPAFAISSNSCA